MFGFLKKGTDKVKGVAMRAFLKKQLANVPAGQREQIMKMFEENPDLFANIQKDIDNKVKNEGKNQMMAAMEVMQKYQGQLQEIYKQSGGQVPEQPPQVK